MKERTNKKTTSFDYYQSINKIISYVTIDYGEAEDFFLGLEKTYGVIIEKFDNETDRRREAGRDWWRSGTERADRP